MNPITVESLAAALGMDEITARVSLSLPQVLEGALHFRAFCFAELLMKRSDLERVIGVTWAEVKKVFTYTPDLVIALIQFNSCVQPFPLEFHVNALMGEKDSIIMNLRRLERELPYRLKQWEKVTHHGMKAFDTSQEILRAMKLISDSNHAHSGKVMSP